MGRYVLEVMAKLASGYRRKDQSGGKHADFFSTYHMFLFKLKVLVRIVQ